jgi:hypothetical protein
MELLTLLIDEKLLLMERSIRNLVLYVSQLRIYQKMWGALPMTGMKVYGDICSP